MKITLIRYQSLPYGQEKPPPFGLSYGIEYPAQKREGKFFSQYQIEGIDTWLPAHCFEEIEASARVETQEEIEERLGASGSDPLALAIKEIMQLRNQITLTKQNK